MQCYGAVSGAFVKWQQMTISFIMYVRPSVRMEHIQAWTCPWISSSLGLPEFLDTRHMKVVKLSGLRTGCPYPQGDTADTFLLGAEWTPVPQCGRKNSNSSDPHR